jgi:hypothetical protein
MCATLGFAGAEGRTVFSGGAGAGSVLETGSAEVWKPHNKPCAMKGNASVWRAGMVLC